jgi:hypothetical protein
MHARTSARLAEVARNGRNPATEWRNSSPPIVNEILRTPGSSLDAKTRALMEPRFGYDFSRVRVYTDSDAAQSAQAVGAMAYTVGRNIVFGAGRYEPSAPQGRRLLAHELAHVVQQQAREAPRGELQIAERDGWREADARSAADAADAPARADAPHANDSWPANNIPLGSLPRLGPTSGPIVQRQPLGTTADRPLNKHEVAVLTSVYGAHLNLSLIRITQDSVLATGAERTLENTIKIGGSTISDSTLIHEAAHCYQHQRGEHYIASSLKAQAMASLRSAPWWAVALGLGPGLLMGSRGAAYDYHDQLAKREPFDDWNSEQQAQWIEDHQQLPPSRRGATGYP